MGHVAAIGERFAVEGFNYQELSVILRPTS